MIERDDCTRVEAGLKSGNSKPVLGLIISSEKMLTLGDPKRGDKIKGRPLGFASASKERQKELACEKEKKEKGVGKKFRVYVGIFFLRNGVFLPRKCVELVSA